jgi:hypothetical protein
MFFSTLASPVRRRAALKVRNIGYGVPSDSDLNFRRYLPAFGQTKIARIRSLLIVARTYETSRRL